MAPPSRRCLGWAIFTSIEIGDAPPGGPPVEPPTRRGFGTRVMEAWFEATQRRNAFRLVYGGARVRDCVPGLKIGIRRQFLAMAGNCRNNHTLGQKRRALPARRSLSPITTSGLPALLCFLGFALLDGRQMLFRRLFDVHQSLLAALVAKISSSSFT
jgi:hypothetical protein